MVRRRQNRSERSQCPPPGILVCTLVLLLVVMPVHLWTVLMKRGHIEHRYQFSHGYKVEENKRNSNGVGPPYHEGENEVMAGNEGKQEDDGDPIDPTNGNPELWHWLFPGRVWLDTDGNPIQAHGGCILFVPESKTFYWYGENKHGVTYKTENGTSRVDLIGVSCYKSRDLWAWENLGVVLLADKHDPASDLHPSRVLERPKVIYNDRTGKYVMWMHVDDGNYQKASAGVATSSRPEGPFQYHGSFRPNSQESRDMTVFKDDDGSAYLIYSSQGNSVLHTTRLQNDYLGVEHKFTQHFVNMEREAPAVFKYKNSYFLITSGCTGWSPNRALIHEARSILGPWRTIGNPMVGGSEKMRDKTFHSQSAFVLQLPGFSEWYIFVADRWREHDLGSSRFMWLPLVVKDRADLEVSKISHNYLKMIEAFDTFSKEVVAVEWHEQWKLPPMPWS